MSENEHLKGEDMQRAFEQFMLQGKGPTATTTAQQHSKTPSPYKKSPSLNKHDKSATKRRQLHRKHYQIFQSFCRSFQDEWMDIDTQLDSVLSSILNLRLRMPKETKLLQRLDRKQDEGENEWMKYGYRSCGSAGETLLSKDIELAISHDIIQHERMLSASRNLLANWGECQESLGRKLDNMMTSIMDSNDYCVDEMVDGNDWATQQHEWLDGMTDVYQMSSMELYRKQVLCHSVLSSVGNKVLDEQEEIYLGEEENHSDSTEGATCPLKAASKCCREWSMNSKKSSMDIPRMKEVLGLADLSDE